MALTHVAARSRPPLTKHSVGISVDQNNKFIIPNREKKYYST